MNITEKSKEYAEGKALSAITSAIEQAYRDGYNDGYNDGINQLIENPEDLIGGVQFVDLDLPSGTQWSSGYVMDNSVYPKFLSYNDALKYNIPTPKQLNELLDKCRCVNVYNKLSQVTGFEFISTNGNKITLPFLSTIFEVAMPSDYLLNSHASFWLKDNLDGDKRLIFNSDLNKKRYVGELFMGFKLPFVIVRDSKR